jgi:hypothetical protein
MKCPTQLVEYDICLLDARTIKQRYESRNPAMQRVINDHINEMLEVEMIEPLKLWSSSVILVWKKEGQYRFYINYRQLNIVTIKDAYPLQQINTTLDNLRGNKYLSTIDLNCAYWTSTLHEG